MCSRHLVKSLASPQRYILRYPHFTDKFQRATNRDCVMKFQVSAEKILPNVHPLNGPVVIIAQFKHPPALPSEMPSHVTLCRDLLVTKTSLKTKPAIMREKMTVVVRRSRGLYSSLCSRHLIRHVWCSYLASHKCHINYPFQQAGKKGK